MFNSFEFRNKALNNIRLHELNVRSGLKHRKDLKAFLITIFKKEKTPLNLVEFIFCDDKYIRNLNKTFLHHDYNTDTITFILSNKNEPISAEGYISIESVKSNSIIFQNSYETELMRVIIHTCLHMNGYSDKKPTEAKKMNDAQEKYLRKWLFHVKHKS